MKRFSSIARKENFKVLFCGHNFSGGFLYSKEAIEKRLVARKEDISRIEVIECDRSEVARQIRSSTVVIPWMSKITADLMDTAPQLRLIMQFGVGLEGVDIPAATKRGIHVARINSQTTGNAQSCAEHCIYLATASLRNVNELQQSMRKGKLGWPVGRTLYAAKTMIIGFGGIGRELLPRLQAMGVSEITIVCRTLPPDVAQFASDPRVRFIRYDAAFASTSEVTFNAEVVFLCTTVNADNVGMINRSFVQRFHPGLHIINVSRGHLMNFPDILDAMNREDNRVAGVGTDVFHTEPFPTPIEEDPFLSHPKVIATPHVAGVTEVSYRRMAEVLADNVLRIYDDQVPTGVVNS